MMPLPKPERLERVGLGDMVAAATKAVGVKPCGRCRKRQEALNALTPAPVGRLAAGIQAIGRARPE